MLYVDGRALQTPRLIICAVTLLLFLSLTPLRALAATYYVSPSGSDSNAGTIDKPWKTVNWAWTHTGVGNTCYFRGGTYVLSSSVSTNSGPMGSSASQRTTFSAYPGETVVWDEDGRVNILVFRGNYVTFKNISFANSSHYGVEFFSDFWIIDGCKFYNHSDDFCKCHGTDYIIQNCEFYSTRSGNSNNLIDSVGGDRIIIRNNYFHDFDTIDQGVLLKGAIEDAQIYNNLFVNICRSDGPWNASLCVGGVTDAEYLGNAVYEIFRPVVYNNVIIGGGAYGILVASADSPKICNNTVIETNGRYPIGVRQSYGSNDSGVTMSPSRNVYMRDNIIGSSGSGYGAMFHVEQASRTGFNSDYNLWYVSGRSEKFVWGGDYSSYTSGVALSAYRTTSGQEAHSTFVALGLDTNGRPKTGSPAIDTGVSWTGMPTTDRDGNLRVQGASVDIGAYEYAGASANRAPQLTWAGSTGYTTDGVNPDTGNATTSFTFKVIYTDADGTPASGGVKLHVQKGGAEITGSPYALTDDGTGKWSTGVVCTSAAIKLAKGSYTYFFAASDGSLNATGSPTSALNLAVANSAPTKPTVSISPSSPTTGQDLVASASGSTDADGDSITYKYAWFKDGVAQTALTGSTVTGSQTSTGQVWRCEVTASDGEATSEAGSAQTTIGNATSNTVPTVTISSPADGSTVKSTSVVVKGTAADDGAVTVVSVCLNGGAWKTATGTTSWECALSGLVVGENTIRVTAKDDTGLWSGSLAPTIKVTLVNDILPLVTITSPADGSTVKSTSVVVKGTATDDGAVTVVSVCLNGGAWKTATGTTSWECALSGLVVGENTIRVTAKDDTGLWSGSLAPTIKVTLVNDILPIVTITSPADGSTVNGSSIVVKGTATDDNAVTMVSVCLNGGAWKTATGTTSWECALTGLVVGENTIRVTAKDDTGLWSGSLAPTIKITLANDILPIVTITSPADGSTVKNSSIVVRGTATDNSAVTIVSVCLNDGAWKTATGTTSWECALTELVNGQNTIKVTAKNDAGLWSGSLAPTIKITLAANEAPTVVITSPDDGSETRRTSIEVRGSATDDGAVTAVAVSLNGGAWQTAEGTSNWTCTLSGLVSGTNTIKVTAKDDTGLWSGSLAPTIEVSRSSRVSAAQVAGADVNQVSGVVAMQTGAGAQVAFVLSADAKVTVEIRNIAGRPIRQVCADMTAARGTNVALWDTRSSMGTRVPAGRYLVYVTAHNDEGTKSSLMAPLTIRR